MGRRPSGSDGAGRPAPSAMSQSHPEQIVAARESALRLLAVRERSAAELRARLRTRGFDPAVVEETLERVASAGLQSDVRFAERFAQDVGGARGWSSRRTRSELLGRGLSRELAEAATEAQDPEDERERARAVALRQARKMAGLASQARIRRLAGLLARRGYDADVCRSVALEVAAETASDVEEEGIP
ncbi:MAG: RecX family transcriptional regulator [Actinomycetota bacterium]